MKSTKSHKTPQRKEWDKTMPQKKQHRPPVTNYLPFHRHILFAVIECAAASHHSGSWFVQSIRSATSGSSISGASLGLLDAFDGFVEERTWSCLEEM